MASTSHSSSFSSHESIRVLVKSINQHLTELLSDPKTRKELNSKCASKLKIENQEFFEFSEQSIISNLYWGIESAEAAVEAKCEEDRIERVKSSERMLQVPALLNEHGVTAGIENAYLICCSYFYLSLVWRLQRDDWQAAIHFLQSLVVSPRIVFESFAQELCRYMFSLCVAPKRACRVDFEEDEVSEEMRRVAKRYKACLTYYRVMAYGETSQQQHGCSDFDSPEEKSQCFANMNSGSAESSNTDEREKSFRDYHNFEKVHPLDHRDDIVEEVMEFTEIQVFEERRKALTSLDKVSGKDVEKSSNIKCVQDLLKEYQSDTPISLDSRNSDFEEESSSEEYAYDYESSVRTIGMDADDPRPQISNKNQQAPCSKSNPQCIVSTPQARRHLMHKEANDVNITKFFSGRFTTSFKELDLFESELRDIESHTFWNCNVEEENTSGSLHGRDFQFFDHIESMNLQNYQFQKNPYEICSRFEENYQVEQNGILEKVISKLCFSEELGRGGEDYTVGITTIYEMLTNRKGLKYSLLKDVILDQLLMAISTSKEEGIIRASVSILSTIISGNKSVIDEIKQKGLQLCDLASALKRNVHEAAILIYLINPTPAEIRTLELIPILVEVICNSNSYKVGLTPVLLTPPAASLMIIEVLVTAFDYATNNTHLAAISSPRVLCEILNVPTNNNLEEVISLASVLVRCMRFDGECRSYLSQCTPVAPFISLLISNQKRAKFIALEFFHEILRIPRSSAITLLQQIKETGSMNIMCVLVLLIQQSQPEYKLLAASLLLQLEMLGNSSGNIIYREAVEALLESLTCEDNTAPQQLSAFILSNLGGTYAWTGEPYAIPWLLKKASLTSLHYKNMIRNVDWLDQSLQDSGIDTWSGKIARRIIKFGNPIFHALEKGLKSKTKRVSRDCLTAIAWLGCEIVKSPNDMRHSACEILLSTIEQYLHPGLELEERLLACLCIYNYTSGRGMQKLIHFSEGVRESLRRLSSITWMAEELLKVADYFQPNKWRISCVHTQILEVGFKNSGAVSALIYYRGQLHSGYADGSIKVWDVKGTTATLVWDLKEHRKAVTCFSLFEPGNCLLSGSADKTIRIWQMVRRKLECIEVIATKEQIQSIDTSGELIFANTQSHKIKVFDSSRIAKDFCKNKNVKCIKVAQGKVYVGCTDLSIQELAITSNRQQEIKATTKSWMTQNKSINSIALYKDWLYSASAVVEGSHVREWRRNSKPQISIVPEKKGNVLAMRVVEDFIYLLCSSATNNLQIWLRGTQHKVGRLGAGNKITSLLTANDMILCGTETGVIKGWIPL